MYQGGGGGGGRGGGGGVGDGSDDLGESRGSGRSGSSGSSGGKAIQTSILAYTRRKREDMKRTTGDGKEEEPEGERNGLEKHYISLYVEQK